MGFCSQKGAKRKLWAPNLGRAWAGPGPPPGRAWVGPGQAKTPPPPRSYREAGI